MSLALPTWAVVGQRIRGTKYPHAEAIITEITARGFKYNYYSPVSFIPRWGLTILGGEIFFDVYPEFQSNVFEPIYETYEI